MSLQKLIVFLRAPRLGDVKTRLMKTIGDNVALAAYKILAESVLQTIGSMENVELRFTPNEAAHEIQNWLGENVNWSLQSQGAGDLGERMFRAFDQSFSGGAKRVVIIGSDCPYLQRADIQEAWAALISQDLVLGPAHDGGYWLIGLRKPVPALFENMKWSSETVFAETVARAKSAGLSLHTLRKLSDIDTADDWFNFQKWSPSSETLPDPSSLSQTHRRPIS